MMWLAVRVPSHSSLGFGLDWVGDVVSCTRSFTLELGAIHRGLGVKWESTLLHMLGHRLNYLGES